jgi:flagellar protein FlgJ
MDSKLSAGANADTGAYTDLNRLSRFKLGGDNEGNIKKVAQEFESLFLNEMMKSMRSANAVFSEGNFMESNETKTYQDMYDQQLAVTLSKNKGGIGLASVLERQLSHMKGSASARPNPFARAHTDVAFPAEGFKAGQGSHAKASVNGDGLAMRDDSKLLNQRRLNLPGKLASRTQTGITPDASTDATQSMADWLPAQRRVAAIDKAQTSAVAATQSASKTAVGTKGKSAFASAEEFVATLLPMAERAAQKIGVDARYLVAQAALETGWGKSIIRQEDGSSSFNLFGIKDHGAWKGDSAEVMTTEYKGGKAVKEAASFRAYGSFEESFEDYVAFLQGNGRYDKALETTEKNPELFARELQKAGYATDPQYARKINQIARKMQTYQTIAYADTGSIRS